MNKQITDLDILYRILNVGSGNLREEFGPSTEASLLSPLPLLTTKEDVSDSESEDEDTSLMKKNGESIKKKKVVFGSVDGATIAYESHPNLLIRRTTCCDNGSCGSCCTCGKPECSTCGAHRKWSHLTQLYIGSITVVGLYVVFRALNRSK